MSFDVKRKVRARNIRKRDRQRRTQMSRAADVGIEYGIRSPNGRITSLTKRVYESICRLLAEGNTMEVSATLSGVGSSTVWNWIRAGQADENGPFGQFARDIAYAKEVSHRYLVKKIAGHDDWKAAAWLLKNKYPHLYADRVSQELSGPDGTPLAPMNIQTFGVVIEMHPAANNEQQPEPQFRIEGPSSASNPLHAAPGSRSQGT